MAEAEAQDQANEQNADQFTRLGFVLAAIGSAIGLGNIWRFPYIAYSNGGGAFLIPYIFALLTAGIPLLIMETVIGHRFRGVTPLAFARAGRKKTEWIAWWQIAVSFIVSTYYAVILAWALSYAYFSFGLQWGKDTEGFLLTDFLQVTPNPAESGGLAIGSVVLGILVPLAIVWAATLGILFRGVRKGLELANRVMIPVLMVMFFAIIVRALTLPGATTGLNELFQPDFSRITDSTVWIAAYSQIFFSLSVGWGIMSTLGSYVPRRMDLNNNAAIAAFSNCSFELLAGIAVFACLGFLATQQGVGVNQVADQGPILAFVIFPQIINTFPGFNSVLGVLFFGSLIVAGVSSLISIVETYVAGMSSKFGWSRRRSVALCGGFGALISLLFTTQGGLYLLDVTDYYSNNFGLVGAGLVEAIAFAWVLRRLEDLRAHSNPISDFSVGALWKIAISVITPIVLGYMLFDLFRTTLEEGYEGYPTSLLNLGWVAVAGAIVVGFLFMAKSWGKVDLRVPADGQTTSQEARA
ncbi:MAG: sodium-dependent transporter [Actinomycetota bacterium]|nr:sodium-dependent transporter [Actinomycetota bacterium]